MARFGIGERNPLRPGFDWGNRWVVLVSLLVPVGLAWYFASSARTNSGSATKAAEDAGEKATTAGTASTTAGTAATAAGAAKSAADEALRELRARVTAHREARFAQLWEDSAPVPFGPPPGGALVNWGIAPDASIVLWSIEQPPAKKDTPPPVTHGVFHPRNWFIGDYVSLPLPPLDPFRDLLHTSLIAPATNGRFVMITDKKSIRVVGKLGLVWESAVAELATLTPKRVVASERLFAVQLEGNRVWLGNLDLRAAAIGFLDLGRAPAWVGFSANSQVFAALLADGTLDIYRLGPDDLLPKSPLRVGSPDQRYVRAALSPDGRYAAAADDSGIVTVWQTATAQIVTRVAVPSVSVEVVRLLTDPLGSTGWQQLFSGAVKSGRGAAGSGPVGAIAFTDDGGHAILAAVGDDGVIRVWGVESGRELVRPFPYTQGLSPATPVVAKAPGQTVLGLGFAPQNRGLVVIDSRGWGVARMTRSLAPQPAAAK